MPNLSLLNQIFDGSRYLLHRDLRIDTMLVEQIDVIDLETPQTAINRRSDMIRLLLTPPW
jgi:hypothetical protein